MRRSPLLIRLSLCICLTTCLGSVKSFAQEAGFLRTDLISPSPTAAQLAKYGEVPVTYYTGLPNVSIPIFNVTGSELSLPIALTYNYSGAQPGQKASWVGLGWSLQAGGVITRTVGDRLDGADGYDIDSATQLSPTQGYLNRSRYFGLHDNLPDVYSFNFGNYSGKFIYVDGNYYIMPKQKLIIGGTGTGDFSITTEDGTIYHFEAREFSTAKPVSPPLGGGMVYNIPTHISAWYLTRITNATETESIRLTYEDDGTMEQFGVRTQSCKVPTNTINQQPQVSPIEDLLPTRVTIKRLKTITSSKYHVDFTRPSLARQDITMVDSDVTYPLGSIIVTSKEGQLKTFKFQHDYIPGPGTEGKALRLKSLTEWAGGAVLQKHSFSYYNEGFSVGTGISSSVDRFGYLLGSSTNTLISNEIWQYGVDRTPVFSILVTGALKTITYPTGRSTTFLYELNRYNDGDRNVLDDETAGEPAARSNPSTTNEIYGIDTLHITHEQDVRIFFTRADKDGPYDSLTDPVEVWHDNTPEFEIRPVNAVHDEEGVFLYDAVGMPVYQGEVIFNRDNDGKTDYVLLDSGRYIIKTICDYRELGVTATAFYEFDTGVKSPGVAGPGIRVKSMEHNNGFGRKIKKSFSYVKENGHCSGVLLQGTSYRQSSFTDVSRSSELFGAIIGTTEYNMYTSTVASVGDIGLPFYYKRVVEDSESGTEVHRTTYDFDYFTQTKNVELLSKTNYLQRGAVFTPMAKEEFTFSNQYNYGSVNGMEIFARERHTYVESGHFYEVYDLTPKNWVEYWKYAARTKQTRYENGQELVTETRSYYDHAGTRNLIGTKTTLEDGSTLFTKYKYPEDYSDIPELDALVSDNMVAPVIEQQVWRREAGSSDSLLISGRINEYESKQLKAIYVIEAAVGINSLDNEAADELISDSRYKKKIEFTYDNAGRLITQQLTDHPVVSYLWGYPGYSHSGPSYVGPDTYPVAEIKNALPDAVFYTSFEQTGTELIEPFSGLRCKADSFKIKKTFTGSYTLTYWKKTGSNPWALIKQTLTNPSNHIITATGSYIDEVRLYPADAQMTTYTYQSGTGIRHVVDVNNRITKYAYDGAGRLATVKDNAENITHSYKYHVKDQGTMLSVE